MIKQVSTRAAVIVALATAVAAFSAGCVDAKKRLQDFDDRVGVSDAGSAGQGCATCNITGRHYLAIDPARIAPGSFIHYIADVEMIEGIGFTVDVTLTALDFVNREVVAGAEPLVAEQLVAMNGTFTIPLIDAVIPAEANSVLSGTAPVVVVEGQIEARIDSDDAWCGVASGATDLGTNLEGSTFGAIKVGPDDIGDALPEPVFRCPDAAGQDAGMPDAAVDAAIDAMPDAAADAM